MPLLLLFLLAQAAPAVPTRAAEECELVKATTPWVSAVVWRALAEYVPSGDSELAPCTKAGRVYAEHLANLTYWATKMYDASSRGLSPGLLEGRTYELGHFEECVSTESRRHSIRGRYVLAELRFRPAPQLYPAFLPESRVFTVPSQESSAWEAVKPSTDRRVADRNALRWALCVPHLCSDQDVERSLQRHVYPALEPHLIQANLSVLPAFSYSREGRPPPPSGFVYVFMCITGLLVSLVVYSTAYDILRAHGKDKARPWFMNFSLTKNLEELFEIPQNEFSVISGIKVLSMFLIIYGHRTILSHSLPQFNPNNNQLVSGKSYFSAMIDNGHIVVNTFMTVTGFLTFYKITKDLSSNKDLRVCRNIFNRFMRLTPAYLFVMAAQYVGFRYYEGGPLSRGVVWDSEVFGKYWWTHLTYLNNYIKPEHQCLLPAWYMALDMQMYIFAYLLGGLLQKVKGLTPFALSLATLLSLAIPAVTVVRTKYWGTYFMGYKNMMDFFLDPEFQTLYITAHNRAGPYLIGMLGGYIYYYIKTNKVIFRKSTLWAGGLVAFGALHASHCWSFPFFIPGRDFVLWENVAYVCLSRLAWAAAIVWIIISTTSSNFRVFQKTLCLSFYEPFNKLNYCALLIHWVVQIFTVGQIRAPLNFGRLMALWMGAGDICISYILSVFLYCLVERPFALLQQKVWELSIFNNDSKSFKK